ncbi:ComF family protein [Carboxylicivirga sp. M1479]|uniref:ComF family protein n=1 Tax=Carboxylicivirga sp. M1479 TaxID=2594476 RepID=UPI00163D91CA|nr:phosphoribosyltransferase family protein [Carboxylicivirga sp. M1479]
MCIRRLPRTYYERCPSDNQVSILMWGRCKIEYAYSLFFYKKGETVQRLLHEIKYRSNKPLGTELGRQVAKTIAESQREEIDVVVPIPLHPKKERKRGFNQAHVIAQGISEVLCKPLIDSAVYRNTHTASQTRKGRYERWQNVENIFNVRAPEQLEGKHVLLVDDVITTGSTMEACINQLRTIEGVKVSVASIAYAVL